MGLSGRRALVTGASRGIGAAVAQELRDHGVQVWSLARSWPQASEHELVCDVSQAEQIRAVQSQVGSVDILVNSAGVATSAPLRQLQLEEWERLFRVNATGTMLCMQAFLPGMVEGGWGRIINIASVAGRTGGKYLAAYSASKHAVLGLTRSVAEEVAARGVTVNALCPGFVDTPLTDQSVANIARQTGRSPEEARQTLTRLNPQGRLIDAEEVAYWTLALCHDRARGVNGQALVIDGGGLLS